MKFKLFNFTKNSKEININYVISNIQKTYPAETNPVYNFIIDSIASTISCLGINARKKKGNFIDYDHFFNTLIRNPNPHTTETPFLYLISNDMNTNGNMYLYLSYRTNGEPIQIDRLPASLVRTTKDANPPFNYNYSFNGNDFKDVPYINPVDNIYRKYPEIIYAYEPKYFDNVIGHSILDYNKNYIMLNNMLLLYCETYIENSAGNRLTIQLDKEISEQLQDDEVKTGFEKWITESIIGAKKAGHPVLLKSGMTLGEIKQPSNVEAELNSMIEESKRTIALMFRFPYCFISGDYGNNLESQNQVYLRQTIQPRTYIIEEALNKILPTTDRIETEIKFDYTNLLMPDVKTWHEIQRGDKNAGIISPNEARRKIDYPKYSGEPDTIGDALMIESNKYPAKNEYMDLYFANAQKTLSGNEEKKA